MARMRGAFSRPRLAVFGAGQPGKPEADPGAADATRARGAQRGPTTGPILGSSQGFFGGR